MKCIFHIALFTFLNLKILSVAGDDDYTPSQSDIDIFFDLCNQFLDSMANCGEDWMDTESLMIEQIGEMSDRIVYTETLILDESEQIGLMSDRIVDTEYLLSNLTVDCMPFCNETDQLDQTIKTDVIRHNNQEKLNKNKFRDMNSIFNIILSITTNNNYHQITPLSMCSPLSSFNEVLNESLIVFDQLCDNITDGIDFMTLQIGIMADRIVATECLIMDMSKQIGYMSDNIVETEELISNMTSSCCLASQSIEESSSSLNHHHHYDDKLNIKDTPPTPDECLNYTNFTDDLLSATEMIPSLHNHKKFDAYNEKRLSILSSSSSQQPLTIKDVFFFPNSVYINQENNNNHHRHHQKYDLMMKDKLHEKVQDGPMPCETWWNPFCCAMEIMTEMMVNMINDMGSMGDQIIALMESSALLIGELADDIVDMEHHIMDVSLIIGEMSDDIVSIETWGEEMFSSQICSDLNVKNELKLKFKIKSNQIKSNKLFKPFFENNDKLLQVKKVNSLNNKQVKSEKLIMNPFLTEQQREEDNDSFDLNDMRDEKKNFQRNVQFRVIETNPFGDFAAMVDLMIKMADTMTTLMTQEMSEMTQVAQACSDMAQQIVKTMGLIGDMAQQINIMAGRVVTTMQLMENLLSDCIPTA